MKKILFGASVYQHLTAFHKPFMQWFMDNGYEVHAIGNNSLGRKEELEQMGVLCHDITFDRSPFSKKSVLSINQLKDLFNNNKFDLIHVHTPTASFLTRYVAKTSNQGKIIYTAHGFHFFKGASLKNWLLFYPAEKVAAKWTDALVVMNREDYESGKKLGFQENKNLFFVNGVGVDFEDYTSGIELNDLRKELKISSNAVIVSCVAELSPRKNQMFLLKNWKAVINHSPNTHLVLIGKGDSESQLRNYVRSEELINVHFLGYRSDIANIISNSDIITLVSKQEGLPRCLMEGMAIGKPIITTNIRGSSELVTDGENGFLVDLEDNENLVEKMIDLVSDADKRQTFGIQGKKKISEYSIDKVLKDMSVIYNKFL